MGESRKKICFVHGGGYRAFEDESIGGTQLQLYFISRALARNEDYEVKFITGVDEYKEMEGVELIPGMMDTDSLSKKILSGVKLTFSLAKVDTDIFFSSNSNVDVFLIALISLIRGKIHFHRTVHERQVSRELWERNTIRRITNHLGMRQADCIFTQSNEHYRKLSEWFDPELEVLPNLFPISNGGSLDGDYILWVARRAEWKRPDLILDLAEKFNSEDFIMISPRNGGDRKYFDKIESRAGELDNLKLIERVPRDQIDGYFEDAKIFVNTSEAEGFPNTFIDSGKSSTPILSYKVDPDSFIEKNNCGFSCNGSYDMLEDRLQQLLEDEEKRVSMGKNCREYVEENHNISEKISILEKRIGQVY